MRYGITGDSNDEADLSEHDLTNAGYPRLPPIFLHPNLLSATYLNDVEWPIRGYLQVHLYLAFIDRVRRIDFTIDKNDLHLHLVIAQTRCRHTPQFCVDEDGREVL